MRYSYERVESIIKKLPVGYYLGRNLNVVLDRESEITCYSMTSDTIYISYPQIKEVLKKIPGRFNVKDTERIVRTEFYHELSHAILTPKVLKISPLSNIFEDERIESKLNGYYKDVNFKELVYLLNHEYENKSALDYFFDLVRFRKGNERLLVVSQEKERRSSYEM